MASAAAREAKVEDGKVKMSEGMKTYEGMFLMDAGSADFETAIEPVRTVLTRNGAEVLALKPWDERRLAYEIRGRRRGLYVLTYFKAPPERIADMERDSQLDERILRMLVLRRDHLAAEQIEEDTPALASAKRAAARKAEEDAAALATQAPDEGDTKTDAPTEAKPDTPAEAEADTPTEAEADAPTEAKADAPAEAEADTPAEAKADAPAEAKADAPAEDKQEEPRADVAEAPQAEQEAPQAEEEKQKEQE